MKAIRLHANSNLFTNQPVRQCPGCNVDFTLGGDHKTNCLYGQRPKPYNFIAYPETGYPSDQPGEVAA